MDFRGAGGVFVAGAWMLMLGGCPTFVSEEAVETETEAAVPAETTTVPGTDLGSDTDAASSSAGQNETDDDSDTDDRRQVCGDGEQTGTEACDDPEGNVPGSNCTPDCTINECGDGHRGPGEACDNGPQGSDTCTPMCASPTCGDGEIQRESGEECDNGDDNGPNANCLATCLIAECGDSEVLAQGEGAELCDRTNVGARTCSDEGFEGGTLRCNADCNSYDTSGCFSCGNGRIDGEEACDGNELGGRSCQGEGFAGGTLRCNSDCELDLDDCSQCGNGQVDAGEQCDGGNLDGQSCQSQGFDSGMLACTASCTFNTNDCDNDDPCGNGEVDPGEDCDGGVGAGTCESERGAGFVDGQLACDDACEYDTGDCCVPLMVTGCSNDDDCCFGRCSQQPGPDVCQCVPANGTCEANGDCCSGDCDDGECEAS